MFLPILALCVACIGLPLLQAWRLLRLRSRDRLGWLLAAADATVFVAVVMLVGRWDIAGYGTRLVLVAILLACLLRSGLAHRGLPWRRTGRPPSGRERWGRRGNLASLLVFGAVLAYLLAGMTPAPPARDVAFPLRDGRYAVGQGGVVSLLNQHAAHRQQAHAADIVALDDFGFRARGILPDRLEAYAIWNAVVSSPCAGTVVTVRDGLPDLAPGEMDPAHPAGNHVQLDCGGFHVLLAHLREGSVRVRAGQRVAAGEQVGECGNSGRSSEPHLHFHLQDSPEFGMGEGMPAQFQRYLADGVPVARGEPVRGQVVAPRQ